MRVRSWLSAFILLATVACVAEARAIFPVEAKLVVPATKILPGVPFEMWIELNNPSRYTVHTAVCGSLRILPVGNPITFRCLAACRNVFDRKKVRAGRFESNADAVLAPGERKTIALPIRGLSGSDILDEIGLSFATGRTLAVAVQLCQIGWPEGIPVPPGIRVPPKADEPLVTNEVKIEIIDPTGSDAEVWQKMLASRDGAWTPYDAGQTEMRNLWSEILTRYPDSNYVPYAVLASYEPTPDVVLDAIRRFPNTPVIELLHVRAWKSALLYGMTELADAEAKEIAKFKRPTIRAVVCPAENGCVEPSH